MRSAGLFLLVVGAMGCSAASSDGSDETGALTPAQTRAVERLSESTGVAWNVEQSQRVVAPSFVAPKVADAGPRLLLKREDVVSLRNVERLDAASLEAASRATVGFLHEHREVFRMRAPAEQLAAMHAEIDTFSMTHVRFAQMERGVPVAGAELYAHYDGEGRLTHIAQTYVPDLEGLDVAPSIAPEVARETAFASARTAAKKTAETDVTAPTDTRLVVLASEGAKPALAWETTLRVAGGGSWRVRVDAHTGAVAQQIKMDAAVIGSGVGTTGVKKPVQYVVSGTKNIMRDTSRAAEIDMFDAQNGVTLQGSPAITSTSTTSWDTDSPKGKGAAVDAQANVGLVTDYYAKNFQRKGWDDKNGKMAVFVHYAPPGDDNADNAFYSFSDNIIAYGDGDQIFHPLAGFFDVTAHEYSHAFTGFTSNLDYINQSGAMNEAISDIFGAIIEHDLKPDEANNFLIGEGALLGKTTALRDMVDPHKGDQPQPSHMKEFVKLAPDQDNGGVHINSGIPNKAFHLMTVGGTHPLSKVTVAKGIGWDNVAKVWYRANQTQLLASSDFAATAKGTLQAATDLKLAQADLDAIDCAWKAVGVVQGDCAKSQAVEPAPTTPGGGTATGDEPSTGDDSESTTTTPKKSTKKRSLAPVASSGCNATRHDAGTGWTALLGLAAFAVLGRRKRS